MAVIKQIIYFLVTFYVTSLVMMFVFQRNLMYAPSSLSEGQLAHSGPFKVLEIQTGAGLLLRSWRSDGDPSKKTFLFFHGNAGNAADRMSMMQMLFQAGHTVVLAEYRGYGDNPGTPTEDKLMGDAQLLIDELLNQGLEVSDIILMGRSLGTGVATYLAAEYDVAALVLISPFSTMVDVAGEHYPYFPVSLLIRDRFDNLAKIKNVTAPLLIFHGEEDQIVPLPYGLKLYEAAEGQKEFIRLPGWGHNDPDMDQINAQILGKLGL